MKNNCPRPAFLAAILTKNGQKQPKSQIIRENPCYSNVVMPREWVPATRNMSFAEALDLAVMGIDSDSGSFQVGGVLFAKSWRDIVDIDYRNPPCPIDPPLLGSNTDEFTISAIVFFLFVIGTRRGTIRVCPINFPSVLKRNSSGCFRKTTDGFHLSIRDLSCWRKPE